MEVYKIESKETKQIVFVGVWEDAAVCWGGQLELLRKKQHPIAKLQAHYLKYKESDFEMSVVKTVKTYDDAGKVIRKLFEPKEDIPQGDITSTETNIVSDDTVTITEQPKKRARRKKK